VHVDSAGGGTPAVASACPFSVLYACLVACQVCVLVAAVAAGIGGSNPSTAHLMAS